VTPRGSDFERMFVSEHMFDRGVDVSKVKLGTRDAAQVSRSLRQISSGRVVPLDLRGNAMYWAAVVRPAMEWHDLQAVAWLLQDASDDFGLSSLQRRAARYWVAYLEARMWRGGR
jgi:hypothetical protein